MYKSKNNVIWDQIEEKSAYIHTWKKTIALAIFGTVSLAEMSSDSRKSLNHRDPFQFLSLDTSLDIKTVILKVSILVSILRLWS